MHKCKHKHATVREADDEAHHLQGFSSAVDSSVLITLRLETCNKRLPLQGNSSMALLDVAPPDKLHAHHGLHLHTCQVLGNASGAH